MSSIGRSCKLVSSVFRSSVLLEQRAVFGRVCSAPRSRGLSWCLPERFIGNVASCQKFTWHFKPKRYYSAGGDSKDSNRNVMSEDEDAKLDNSSQSVSSQSSSQTFNLDVLVSLLRQENAVDLCVIKLPEHINYTEYFIVVSGVSPRHLRAMALYTIKVYKFLRKASDPHVKLEGKDAEDWMCIDFGNIIVHFMLPETREVYELEKLWTLRGFDEQLKSIPAEMIPEDFILEVTK
ncbi:mitochondrial assembly of ribosomal large subunit protein 1 [Pholidichthys leucotaenia]